MTFTLININHIRTLRVKVEHRAPADDSLIVGKRSLVTGEIYNLNLRVPFTMA